MAQFSKNKEMFFVPLVFILKVYIYLGIVCIVIFLCFVCVCEFSGAVCIL